MLERRMTLAEAQAIECNGCGDCCDSKRAGRTEDGRYAWRWGRILGGEKNLIIPIEPAEPGRIEAFMCCAFMSDGETGRCMTYELRPERCRSFPVFGAHAVDIARELEAHESYALPLSGTLFRCAWAGVSIIRDHASDPAKPDRA